MRRRENGEINRYQKEGVYHELLTSEWMVGGWRNSKEVSAGMEPFREPTEKGPVNSDSPYEECQCYMNLMLHSACLRWWHQRILCRKKKIGSSFKVIILIHEYLQNIYSAEPYLGNHWDEIFEVLLMISWGERQCIIESLKPSSFFYQWTSISTQVRGKALFSKSLDFL